MINFENLRICTLNVCSIINDEKRRTLFNYLKTTNYDAIALQETASLHQEWTINKNNQWSREWGPGRAVFTKHCAILLNNPRLSYTLKQQFLNGRVLAIDLYTDDDLDDRLRVINLYVPCTRDSDVLFDTFINQFPVADLTQNNPPLIVLGDLNISIDPRVDRKPPMPIDGTTTARWRQFGPLMTRLGVSDVAPPPRRDAQGMIREIHFTHVAKHRWTTLTRIDYIMVSQNLLNTVTRYQVSTMPVIKTDHRLVEAVINTNRPPTPPPQPIHDPALSDAEDDGPPNPRQQQAVINKPVLILDTRILRDIEFQREIRSLISQCVNKRAARPHLFRSPGEFWDDCKKKCLFAGLQYRKRKRYQDSRERVNLQQQLKEADLALETQPNHPQALDTRHEAWERLCNLEAYRMDRALMISKVKWIEEGERATPEFTKQLKKALSKRSIMALKDGAGIRQTQQPVVEEIARSFYERLYSSEPTDRAAQDTLLAEITNRLSPELSARMDCAISLAEIEASIISMDDRSSPGSDGLPYEFYKTFRPEIAPILLEVVNSVTTNGGHLPVSHQKALTTLIFKKGDNELIQNYRPISLTQCDYKIFTKVLTNRMNEAAQQVIGAWQTGFIPGRQGHDNVRLLELVALSLQTGDKGDAAILSLDQEKAYDRVEWSYMHRVLEAFGFGPRIRSWVRSCYSDLSASIIMNRNQSAPYQACRGLRQGDPLAPLLFNFVLEPFLLHYERHAAGIPAAGIPFKVAAFADDTTLGITPGDEPHVRRSIELHELASGAKINKLKTALIPFTANASTAINLRGFPSRPFNEPFTHLGVVLQAKGRDMVAIERECHRFTNGRAGTGREPVVFIQGQGTR